MINQRRTLGIKIIAWILFLDALILMLSAAAAYSLPEQMVSQINQTFGQIPYFKRLPLAVDPWSMLVAAFLGVWAAIKGLGIWFMRSWARLLIVIDLTCRFADFAMFAALQDRKWLDSFLGNQDLVIGFIINLFILIYLSDASVKEIFEKRTS